MNFNPAYFVRISHGYFLVCYNDTMIEFEVTGNLRLIHSDSSGLVALQLRIDFDICMELGFGGQSYLLSTTETNYIPLYVCGNQYKEKKWSDEEILWD